MEEIIKILAEKHRLPEIVVREAVLSMFKYTKDMMAEDKLEGMKFIGLGKFIVKPYRKKYILKYREIQKRLNDMEEKYEGTKETV